MRKVIPFVLVAAVVLAQAAHGADNEQTAYYDTLVVEASPISIKFAADQVAQSIGCADVFLDDVTPKVLRRDRFGDPVPAPSDTAQLQSKWIRYRAINSLGRGGAETFFSTDGLQERNAIDPSAVASGPFEWIEYRLTVTLIERPDRGFLARNQLATPHDKTLVIAAAQFRGAPRRESGGPGMPIDLASSGVIERDFLRRLLIQLGLKK